MNVVDVLTDLAIQRKATIFLQEKLTDQPDNLELKKKLAGYYRQTGEIKKAISLYKQIIETNAQDIQSKAFYFSLTNKEFAQYEDKLDIIPSNFMMFKSLLLESDVSELLDKTLGLLGSAQNSTIFEGVQPEIRHSLTVYEKDFLNIAEEFRSVIVNNVLKQENNAWANIEAKKIELQMNMYLDGAYYKMHRDSGQSDNRKLTCVYYYYQQPKGFSGGDFILYDKVSRMGTAANSYLRINPQNNSMVVFNSDAYHQVTPVTIKSRNPQFGRFSLTSWIYN